LSSMGPLMGVQPDSGSTDPGAAVTRPDSDMTAGLHTVLAGCTLRSRIVTRVSSNLSIA